MTERSSMSSPALLPDELLWADGGHASDVVLTALADGERSIVPPALLAHVSQCTLCTTHLGNAALLSLHVATELDAVRAQATTAAARRPLPRRAISLGLLVAALGLLPTALDAAAFQNFVTHDIPVLARGLGTVAMRFQSSGGPLRLVLPYATAAFLIAMGFAVIRFTPKKETSR